MPTVAASARRSADLQVGDAVSCLALLSSCSPQTYAVSDPTNIEAGIVFDIGGKDDRSFNAAAWNGMKCAETGKLPDGTDCGKPGLGIVLRDVEPGTPVSIEPAMRAFAERKYDVIVGIGFAQAPILDSVAKDYPDIQFAIVDGVSELPNVASLVFKEHEGSYLVGILAAMTSKTGTHWISRRHGHRPDSPVRQGLRTGRAIGEPEHPRARELRRRHRCRVEQPGPRQRARAGADRERRRRHLHCRRQLGPGRVRRRRRKRPRCRAAAPRTSSSGSTPTRTW